MALKQAEATADIAAGTGKTAASQPFPYNIPLILGFIAQVVGIVSTIKSAASSGSSVKKSFATGGFTDMFGMGYRDQTGHEVAGAVHVNEYVVPEFLRKEPEMPYILGYIEKKRKTKLGLYADGGDTVAETSPFGGRGAPGFDFGLLEMMLNKLMLKLDTPFQQEILFGPEAELKRQEQEKKIKKIQTAARVKKN